MCQKCTAKTLTTWCVRTWTEIVDGADTIAGVTSGEGAPPVRAKPMDGSMELEMFQAQKLVCGCDLRKTDNAELWADSEFQETSCWLWIQENFLHRTNVNSLWNIVCFVYGSMMSKVNSCWRHQMVSEDLTKLYSPKPAECSVIFKHDAYSLMLLTVTAWPPSRKPHEWLSNALILI